MPQGAYFTLQPGENLTEGSCHRIKGQHLLVTVMCWLRADRQMVFLTVTNASPQQHSMPSHATLPSGVPGAGGLHGRRRSQSFAHFSSFNPQTTQRGRSCNYSRLTEVTQRESGRAFQITARDSRSSFNPHPYLGHSPRTSLCWGSLLTLNPQPPHLAPSYTQWDAGATDSHLA